MTEHTLTFNDTDIQVIGRALGEMPFRDVYQVIAKLNEQLTKKSEPEGNK